MEQDTRSEACLLVLASWLLRGFQVSVQVTSFEAGGWLSFLHLTSLFLMKSSCFFCFCWLLILLSGMAGWQKPETFNKASKERWRGGSVRSGALFGFGFQDFFPWCRALLSAPTFVSPLGFHLLSWFWSVPPKHFFSSCRCVSISPELPQRVFRLDAPLTGLYMEMFSVCLQLFHVAYVLIKFANSPRPDLWVLERSTDFGQTYQPWQYFACKYCKNTRSQ